METVGALLWRVTNRWRAAVDRGLAPLGLTHSQYSLMATLYGMGRAGITPSQRELGARAGFEPMYVSKVARQLEQAGLLARARHPDDPRALGLALTERGTEVILRAIPVVRGLQAELTAPIGGPEGARAKELADVLRVLLGLE
ncbi:MarR family winged helix-turn-helix transcriptional regulator [Actinoplanes sp. CA-142083]|uniref:MarR family winged helix-turn-helix transcriptional regulator n=1 Tax=Actinoplanes sp. CA-142083 TaxID=3239903 RepID=UPI003D89BD2F